MNTLSILKISSLITLFVFAVAVQSAPVTYNFSGQITSSEYYYDLGGVRRLRFQVQHVRVWMITLIPKLLNPETPNS